MCWCLRHLPYIILSFQDVNFISSFHIFITHFFFIQSHFIAELIKTDWRESLVIFMFLIEHPWCFWLWILGTYNAPGKEENLLWAFSFVSSMEVLKISFQQLWNIKMLVQMFPGRSAFVTLSNVIPTLTFILPYDAVLFSLEYLLPCKIILVSYGPACFSPSWRWKQQE